MKKRLIIFGTLFLVALVGAAGFAYRLYNKPHRDISAEAATFQFTEMDLEALFEEDVLAADKKLRDQVLEVRAVVKSKEQTASLQHITFDRGGNFMVSVALDSTETKQVAEGQELVVKGLYVGAVEGDTDFGIPGEIKIKNAFIQ